MNCPTIRVDEKGRVIIPKKIRQTTKLKEGSYVTVKSKGNTIILEPVEPVADKYYGAFKVTNWPENLDDFTIGAVNKWWKSHGT